MSQNGPIHWALLLLAGCGGAQPQAESGPRSSCSQTLAARSAEVARLPPEAVRDNAAPSRIVTHAELRLARLAQELEAKLDKRLAEARDVSIGVAGVVHYVADRGPLRLSVEGDSLIVRTEVTAHAQACSRGRCYASCDPVALARAEIPLRLDERYGFAPSRVTSTFTRGCKVRALGGFLTIDVTPTIEARLAPELRKVERVIDQRLPKFEAQAKRLWAELFEPRPLPLGGCVVVQPRGIVQGPVEGDGEVLRLRFGLLAQPEIRTRCGEPAAASALPPLAQDRALRAEEEVDLGLVAPLAGVASALEAATLHELRIQRAAVAEAGSAVDADLTLDGGLCGELSLRASLAWSGDGRSLTLTSPTLPSGERERVEATSLDPHTLGAELARAPRIGVPIDPQALAKVVPLLASSQSSSDLEVSARVTSVRPGAAVARGDDFVAKVRVRGRLDLKQK